jgi:hypothetical protein
MKPEFAKPVKRRRVYMSIFLLFIFLVVCFVLWCCGGKNLVEGIIGNDHAPRNAREWKARERVGTWKENALQRQIERSRERIGLSLCFVWMD